MLNRDRAVGPSIKGHDIKAAVYAPDVFFHKISLGGVDNALALTFSDRAERRAEAAKGIILYLYEDEDASVIRDEVDLSLLGTKIPFNDAEPFFCQVFAGGVFSPIPKLLAFFCHDACGKAIIIPG